MKTKFTFLGLLIVIAIISCKKNNPSDSMDESYSATPLLPEVQDNYTQSSNDAMATLGRVLFYDRSLSLNNSVSCGSCHQQSKAFCDNLQFSVGLEDQHTSRNTPSIFAKTGRMFWDGRASSMQDLVLRPIKNHVEMKFENLEALAAKVAKISYYPELFNKAFGNTFIDSSRIKLAISEFLRNFNFSDNKFNRTEKSMERLSASENLGKTVFFSKGKCSTCHHIESQNTFMDSTKTGYGFTNMEFNIGLDQVYSDNGTGAITRNSSQDGKFMVPVLLNVEYTAPYMHDGRFKTLEEVVEHYNSGIQNHPNLDAELRDLSKFENMSENELMAALDLNKNGVLESSEIATIPPARLNLTDAEKKGLVAFLKTMSDPNIFTDARFRNPFAKK
jgi:cytochrome c peroxidase